MDFPPSILGVVDALNIPVLHGDPRLLSGPLWTNWRIDPTVAFGAVALGGAYLAAIGPLNRRRPDVETRPVRRGQVVSFLTGCVVLLVALGPPIEDWAGLLLAAHMVQHLLLMLVVVPLLLIGTPDWMLRPLLRWRAVRLTGNTLTRPVPAFAVGAALLAIWHFPVFYEASLRKEPIHVIQHLSLLVGGVLTWWPLIGPLPEWPQLALPLKALYLFFLTIPGGFVGSFITFADPGLYEPYSDVPRMWGIGLAVDQELGGTLMWVGASLVYLVLIGAVFQRWAAKEA